VQFHPNLMGRYSLFILFSVQDVFPELVSGGSLVHLRSPEEVEERLIQSDGPPVLMVVGAIPAIKPVTKEERMVYTIASHIFTMPYGLSVSSSYDSNGLGALPLPTKRLFLEMAYKPRVTPMVSFIFKSTRTVVLIRFTAKSGSCPWMGCN